MVTVTIVAILMLVILVIPMIVDRERILVVAIGVEMNQSRGCAEVVDYLRGPRRLHRL